MTVSSPAVQFALPSQAEFTEAAAPRVRQTQIRPQDWEAPADAVQRGDSHAQWVGSFVNQSPEWHAARAGGLGGSEVAAVVGLSKWESRFSLWHRKQDHLPEKVVGDPADWGTRLEAVVGQHFQSRHPELHVMPSGTFCSSKRPWQIANPDLLAPGAIVEVKTALYDYAWGADGTDEIPIYYRAQVTWYMDVLGIDVAWLCVLIGGWDYREYRIPYDEDDALYLRTEGAAFMASIAAGVEPEIDGHWETKAAVEHLHPEIERRDVEIEEGLAREFEAALRGHKAATEAKNQATARMIDALGTARRGVRNGLTLGTRVPGRGGANPYLRANPALLESQEAPAATPAPALEDPSKPIVTPSGVATLVERTESVRWMLGRAGDRSAVMTIAALLGDKATPEEREMVNQRWRELPIGA